MLITLSPAKRQEFDAETPTAAPWSRCTRPAELSCAADVCGSLARVSRSGLADLMGLSPALAALHAAHHRAWAVSAHSVSGPARAAALAFRGDVYRGFDAPSLSVSGVAAAQSRVRVLSGLYGVLRPKDLILPHRLEMGCGFGVGGAADLYAYWRSTVTARLSRVLRSSGASALVNLASVEYAKALDVSQFSVPTVSPVFLDESKGRLRTIALFAKRARGRMARWIVDTCTEDACGLSGFDLDGYRLDASSSAPHAPVFVRTESARLAAAG